MKTVLTAIFGTIAGLGYLAIYIGGTGIHLFTTYIAWSVGGFLSALITFMLPIISELYWFFSIWHETGQFINGYSIWFLLVLACLLIVFVSIFIMSLLED